MAMHSDMEILTEMLSGDESPFGEIIEKDQDIAKQAEVRGCSNI